MPTDKTIQEQALAWAVKAADPAFERWEEFTLWLESDPAHAQAYNEISASVAEATDALAQAEQASLPVANDDDIQPINFSRRWLGGAVAAALVLAVTFGFGLGDGKRTLQSEPGEVLLVELEDGGSIELAGGSRIEIDEDNPRFAQLEYGQAIFTIVHDESDPFVVLAGGQRLVDVGTVFDVNLRADGLVLGVSEGAVIFNPDRQAVTVEPGQMLFNATGSEEVEMTEILPEMVGEWREGRLTFDQVSLGVVASELTRATGVDFAAANGGGSEISGSIIFSSIAEDPAMLEDLLGVRVRPDGQGWVIEGR